MSGFLSDRDAIAQILQHVNDGTTDHSEEVWREPVANYTSPERLDRESFGT